MQAPEYGAEVPGEEQEGNSPEGDEEGGDLVLYLVVVGLPDFGAERMMVGCVATDDVPRRTRTTKTAPRSGTNLSSGLVLEHLRQPWSGMTRP
jgi:hypothetical protein